MIGYSVFNSGIFRLFAYEQILIIFSSEPKGPHTLLLGEPPLNCQKT